MHGKRHSANNARRLTTRWVVVVALMVSLLASGCRTCQFPRIDPTGQRIFAPGTTTLDPQLGQLPTPQPAFIAPPAPPSCEPGQPGCKKQHVKLNCDKLCDGIQRELRCVGHEGQLLVTPASVIAPIGSEVVLLAGLCGPDRTFVARQPIEFVMSQESVGNFVAVGEDGECSVTRLYRDQPQKATSGYVVGVSSASDQTITRGTPQPNDDIRLGKGQTWLSVTSPSEGTSYITVLAPKADNWDQRRQTAVIHWVDAQWQLPAPAVVPAGRPHRLTTIVRRAAGATPATGWTVRYSVTGGEPAGFAPNGQTTVDVPVDAQGLASVDIQQQASAAGATTVSIQILRPGFVNNGAPVVVGQGWTSITWSAPGLAVQINGPQSIPAGTEATFRIDVTNPGDIASRDVVVSTQLPPSLEFLGANPPPQQLGERFDWRLGDIGPKETRTIQLRSMARLGGDIRFGVQARSADGVTTQGSFASRVNKASLSLVMTGPPTAFVGDTVTFRLEVANTGDQPLSNVKLTSNFDAGLEHDKGLRSPVAWVLGDLQPGQRDVRGITFIVRQPGQLCVGMEATADGAEIVPARACVNATVKQVSSLQVAKAGPAEVAVGGTAEYTIEVTNNGNTPLTNVRIIDQYSDNLMATAGTKGYAVENGAITWTIPELGPGVQVRRRIACQAVRADANAVNRVRVETQEGVVGGDEVVTRIVAAGPSFAPRRLPVEDLRGAAESGNVNADGALKIDVRATNDSAKVGDSLTYFITVTNARQVSDRQVKLRITLPEGLTFVKFGGRYQAKPVGPENRVIEVTPIAEMRPGEAIDGMKLEVHASEAGKYRIEVEAVSQRSTSGVKVEQATTVFP